MKSNCWPRTDAPATAQARPPGLPAVLLAALLAANAAWPTAAAAPAAGTAPIATGAPDASPAPAAPRTFQDCPSCPEMVVVPAGEVTIGSSPDTVDRGANEGPRRRVRIARPLAVARFEVTRAQWQEFVVATARTVEPGCQYYDGHYGYVLEHDWRTPGFPQRPDHPVVCVSVPDAEAYAAWLGARTGRRYRLPTSVEFEYFNRAGGDGAWFWGNDSTRACEHANVGDTDLKPHYPKQQVHNCRDDYRHTAPVGRFRPNAFGLHDTVGNVFEWTIDCWHPGFDGAPADGSPWLESGNGDCAFRTPRGGSWISGPNWTRAAAQSRDPLGYRSFLLGFRLVADPAR